MTVPNWEKEDCERGDGSKVCDSTGIERGIVCRAAQRSRMETFVDVQNNPNAILTARYCPP